ncbi:MAG: hypothetical protein GXP04_08395 [Alphaproteobacteria bacterium]|nr:hypothetical protein [Alphaproteobacteria bacterium]
MSEPQQEIDPRLRDLTCEEIYARAEEIADENRWDSTRWSEAVELACDEQRPKH